MQTAKIIAQQIGKQALFLMGAKQLIASDNALLIKIGRNAKNVSFIKVELNANDLYNITFSNVRSTTIKTLAEVKDVYCDQLHPVIEKNTGLYLHF